MKWKYGTKLDHKDKTKARDQKNDYKMLEKDQKKYYKERDQKKRLD